jgi:NAD(P)-dependent dehydrogenase (short-subunit alcohol dehydrogenase family)
MDLQYDGQVVLITGASRGLGFAMAQAFVGEGCRVVIGGRDSSTLEEARARLGDPARVLPVAGDLLDDATATVLVDRALEAFGRVDVLVNNAAEFGHTTPLELAYAEWESLLRLKTFGYVRMAAAAVPHIAKAGGGAILNVAGAAALRASRESAHVGPLNAAILNWSDLLARELAPKAIRVNVITPGPTRTHRLESRIEAMMKEGGIAREAAEEKILQSIPAGVFGNPDEIGVMAATICSPRFRSLVGANVIIDGGKHC